MPACPARSAGTGRRNPESGIGPPLRDCVGTRCISTVHLLVQCPALKLWGSCIQILGPAANCVPLPVAYATVSRLRDVNCVLIYSPTKGTRMLYSRRVRGGISAILLVTFTAGCGTMFGGTSQNVRVASSPDNAEVEVEDGATHRTPTTLDLERGSEYVLEIDKEGYEAREVEINKSMRGGILALDILFTGLLGVVVDAATGGWYSLSPERVDVSLTQADASDAGPDEIDVQLNADDGKMKVDSDEPVTIEVRKVPE